jgi:SulP family sulfate permease
MRTTVNVYSGATHRTSEFISSIIVFILVFRFLPLIAYLPSPVIAAILIMSAVKLIPIKIIKYFFKVDPVECFILIGTTLVSIIYDGAYGLLVGTFVCLARNVVN